MANAGVNNVPAAGEWGADPVVASEEGEAQSPPPSFGYNASSEGSEGYLTSAGEGERSGVVSAPLLPGEASPAAVWSLAFGSASKRGLEQRKGMEDTVSLHPFFYTRADGSPMHFFAVFDGHDGPQGTGSLVLCEPDITMTTRSEDDDCLILASDGLWDVIENQMACNVVRNSLEFEHNNNQGAPRGGALIGQEEEVGCIHAGTLLKNMAICKHSQDDISVAVLDLKARC